MTRQHNPETGLDCVSAGAVRQRQPMTNLVKLSESILMRSTLGKSSPAEKRGCPFPRWEYRCACGSEPFYANGYPISRQCIATGCFEMIDAEDNPARDAWFAEQAA